MEPCVQNMLLPDLSLSEAAALFRRFPCDSSLQISSLVIVKAVTLCKAAHSQNLQLRLVFVKETIPLAKIV